MTTKPRNYPSDLTSAAVIAVVQVYAFDLE